MYSDDGSELGPPGIFKFEDTGVNFTNLDPKTDYCIAMAYDSYLYYYNYTIVECNTDDEAYYLCRKSPLDCSTLTGSGSGTGSGAARRKRLAGETEKEPSLDKVFNLPKKKKYDDIAIKSQETYKENFKKMNLEKSYENLFEILW